jgi:hypothetical protein
VAVSLKNTKSTNFARRGEIKDLAGATATMIELVLNHFAAQGVAMNTEKFGGARLVAVGAVEYPLDKALFEFAYRFIEQNAPVDHQRN